jgi:hypothetical protein
MIRRFTAGTDPEIAFWDIAASGPQANIKRDDPICLFAARTAFISGLFHRTIRRRGQ